MIQNTFLNRKLFRNAASSVWMAFRMSLLRNFLGRGATIPRTCVLGYRVSLLRNLLTLYAFARNHIHWHFTK